MSAQTLAQTPDQIAAALEEFLAEHARAVVLEDGKVLFDMREAKYRLATEHGRCTLHLWGEERNLVRRVSATTMRNGVLRLSTHRFGQTKPQTLELVADRDRRTPSTREATRVKYLRVLERVLLRSFPEYKADAFRTAMDLEKSFGPAYARGSLLRGSQAWAVIAVNEEETQATVDGILTLGILWLQHCRESGDGRRLYQGLKLIVAAGYGDADAVANGLAECERCAVGALGAGPEDGGAGTAGRCRSWEPDDSADARAEQAGSTGAVRRVEVAGDGAGAGDDARCGGAAPPQRDGDGFLLHGLEFARVRMGYAGNSFNSAQEITFGAGANETPLTEENEAELRELVARLFARRIAGGDKRDPLYRMQPERWLESVLRRDVASLDAHLDSAHVYTQVPAFAAADRGMLDLLGVTNDGRLAVIELKADDDLQLALQGLDYWVRVRWHHLQNPDNVTGLGEFQRHGYFGGLRLSAEAPRLYLVAPALRIHPATEVVLRYLSPRVEWILVALNERWRAQVKAVWRKRSGA
jgi:hypothetical protein